MLRRTFLTSLLLSLIPTTSYADTPKSELYIIYFGAKWCGPCKTMGELLKDPDVTKEVELFDHDTKDNKPYPYYIDIDNDPKATEAYGVVAIPQIVIVEHDDGDFKVVRRYIGSPTKQKLLQFLAAGKKTIDTSAKETMIIPPVWTLKGVVLFLFKLIKILLG